MPVQYPDVKENKMTEEEKQKLNEKLAKWANAEVKVLDWERIEAKCSEAKLTNDGYSIPCDVENYTEFQYPDFTDSLDACFRWLVPKVLDKRHWLGLVTTSPSSGHTFTFVIDQNKQQKRGELEGSDRNPALALCLAIEKLIEK